MLWKVKWSDIYIFHISCMHITLSLSMQIYIRLASKLKVGYHLPELGNPPSQLVPAFLVINIRKQNVQVLWILHFKYFLSAGHLTDLFTELWRYPAVLCVPTLLPFIMVLCSMAWRIKLRSEHNPSKSFSYSLVPLTSRLLSFPWLNPTSASKLSSGVASPREGKG